MLLCCYRVVHYIPCNEEFFSLLRERERGRLGGQEIKSLDLSHLCVFFYGFFSGRTFTQGLKITGEKHAENLGVDESIAQKAVPWCLVLNPALCIKCKPWLKKYCQVGRWVASLDPAKNSFALFYEASLDPARIASLCSIYEASLDPARILPSWQVGCFSRPCQGIASLCSMQLLWTLPG